MSDIKQDVKATVKVFIQMIVSIVVRESTKKMIKNLTERQRKKFEDKIKDLPDDQLAHYFDKNPYFKNALKNTIKSVIKAQSAKKTLSLMGKLQSIFEATSSINHPVSALVLPAPKIILSLVASTAILATAAVPVLVLVSQDTLGFPAANFSSNITSGYPPLSVRFTDLSQNATALEWEFGDGTTSNEQNPTHIYSAAGKYRVKLTAKNENGTDSTSGKITVLEKTVLPVAGFSSSVTMGYAPLSVQFTDLSYGAAEWKWDFGDGTTSTEQNPTHTYFAAGKHTVKLTIGNKNGIDSKLATITVIPVYAYITNAGSNNVSIINTATKIVTATVNTGIRPYGVAVSPDRTKVYVTNSGDGSDNSGSVSVIDTTTNTLTATLSAGNNLRGIAVNPAGTKAYVANSGNGSNDSSSIFVIDTAANTVVATVSVGAWPEGVAVNPAGTKVYVANMNSDNVSVIDTATNTVTATVNTGTSPHGVAVTPDGTKVYVANRDSSNVSVIDTATNNVTSTVPVGENPFGVTVTPNGTKAYVTNEDDNTVSVIDIATNTVRSTVPVGESPEGIAVTPEGNEVFVANMNSSNISVIDTATDSVTATVPVGSLPAAFGQFTGLLPAPSMSPVANFSSNITSGYAPLSVRFTDLSYGATGWSWSFGDGNNSTEQNPVHTYSTAGNYTVKLIAANSISTDSTSATITALEQPVLPVANFSSSVTLGPAPLTVHFTDLSENATEWDWNFGDGNSSTEQNPIHTYSSKGNYIVNLTAINANGTNSKLATIMVGERQEQGIDQIIFPVANFSSDVTDGPVPLLIRFTDLSQNATGWNWDFGDGTISSEQNPTHTFFAAGNYTINLTAANANGTSSKDATINVLRATPIITWSNPANITYGIELNSTQLNAVSSVPGTFNYTPGNGTVLSAGTKRLDAIFTPADPLNYTSASTNITINISQANPIIVWNSPVNITFGTTLNETQLNAIATSVNGNQLDGTFQYTLTDDVQAFGAILEAGTHKLYVDFTPIDATNYITTSNNVTINVTKANPEITWSNPADIIYGTLLSDIQLNATAISINGEQLNGTFVYNPGAGTVLSASMQALSVDFVPDDAINYTTTSKNVTLNVTKAIPEITWSSPADIIYGTPLNNIQLNATAFSVNGTLVDGNFVYNPATGTVLGAGTQTLHVDFTPYDAVNYSETANNITISVQKANPTITWSNPSDIIYGTALSGTQLNAIASVPGSFVYNSGNGTILSAGTHTLRVNFTPEDPANYTTASNSVTINITKAIPEIIWNYPSDITYGIPLDETQLNATATSANGEQLIGTFDYYLADYVRAFGAILEAGTDTLYADFTPNDMANYTIASKNVTINISQANPIIIWSNPDNITYRASLNETQLNAIATSVDGEQLDGIFVYTPEAGTVLSADDNQNLHVEFTPTDNTNYNATSMNVTINVSQAIPEITWNNNPYNITYGTALSDTQLNASASVPGILVYTPVPGTVLGAGENQNLSVDFTPNDIANYTLASMNVTINVNQANPIITWSNPDNITYGTQLNSTQLDATATSVNGDQLNGTFGYYLADYVRAFGAILETGTHTLYVDFTPDDSVNYSAASKDVIINVSEKPVIPVANFSSDVTEDFVPFSVQFTDDSQNATGWNWDFGDGSNSTEQNPTHTYFSGGNYTVNLTVNNAYGTDSKIVAITAFEYYAFVSKWGSRGIDYGQFDFPSSVAVDLSGNIYVADSWNNRIQKFSSNGTFITKWGSSDEIGDEELGSPSDEIGDGQFAYPMGVAVDSSGYVYVADTFINRIQKFDSNGAFITKWGSYGSEDRQFDFPVGIAVDSSGNVYVADTGNNRTQKFDSDGVFITEWGSYGSEDGQFDSPMGIAVDSSGNVYVADTGNNRTQKFDSDGVFITEWGSYGSEDGQFDSPMGIAVDSSNDVYVADSSNHRIQKFDSSGEFITKWGSSDEIGDEELGSPSDEIGDEELGGPSDESGDGQLDNPEGVAIDSLGNVYVADAFNHRIQKFAKTKLGFPVADFITNVNSGYLPLSVQFNDISKNATEWNWVFGDGEISTEQNPTHTYYGTGNYTVNLTVSNIKGTSSKTTAINVSVPQSDRSGGPDNFNYTFKDSNVTGGPTYDWIEISGTGTQILNDSDDAVQDNVDLGFFFNYYGTDFSRVAISSNGLLVSSGTSSQFENEPIGQSPGVHGFIAPFWDDLVTLNGGKVSYQTLGTAPNRIFVTEWVDTQYISNSGSKITFELILYEGSNNIKFQYKDVDFGSVQGVTSYDKGGSATVGIESPDGTDGLQYSFNEQVIDSGKAILFKYPQLPVANFSTNVTSGYVPLSVQFTDQSENATGWIWVFGDGTTSTEQNPTHTYFSGGNYTVNLTVNNANGTDSKIAAITAFEYYAFIAKWGSEGSGDGQFEYPMGIELDPLGNVYVVDLDNNRIQKFDSNGTFITKWGSEGSDDGQFFYPEDVAVDSSGNVYVADTQNNRIQKFDSNGNFITKWGSYGSSDGQFDIPEGIAVDSSGNVYVAELYGHRIQKFSSDGTFITKWGSKGSGDGQLSYPEDIEVDSSSNAYVADWGNNRIQKFDSNGNFITKWGSEGSDDGQFESPISIAADSSGNVYVADVANNRIQKFDSDGNVIITKWGSNGIPAGRYSAPHNLVVDSSGNVYVATNLIQKFAKTKPGFLVADFITSANSDYGPLTVQFLDSSKNATEWNWDFGDGFTSDEQSPAHTYLSAGTYAVTLNVSNAYFTDQKTDTITVSMGFGPGSSPVANFNANPTSGYPPLSVQFTDLSENAAGWFWDFGDGTVSTEQSPEHTFSAIGNYTVSLTATNLYGSDSRFAIINVLKPTGTFAYIPNAFSNTVSIIDTATDSVTATLQGLSLNNSLGVAVTPDGTKMYVTNLLGNDISVIDTINRTILATVPVGSSPYGVAVTPDGTKVYVTNTDSNNVSVIDTTNNVVTDTLNVGDNPRGVAVAPDGTTVYVANAGSNTVSVIDTMTNNITDSINVGISVHGGMPWGITITPDGTKVYVVNTGNNNDYDIVSVIDTASNTVITTINVGAWAREVAVNPAGTKVYVTNIFSDDVSVIDAATNNVTATVKVGDYPLGIAFTPDGTKVYVTNFDSSNVSVIDAATDNITSSVAVGAGPFAFGQFIGTIL